MQPGDDDLQIRQATWTDIPALTTSFGSHQGAYYRQRMSLQATHKGTLLVAERDKTIVGAVYLSWDRPKEREVRRELPSCAVLYRIEVQDSVRCQGIGTRMMAAAHRTLHDRGHRWVALGVGLENKDAIRLYERLGYQDWGQGAIGAGASAYTMMVFDLAGQFAGAR